MTAYRSFAEQALLELYDRLAASPEIYLDMWLQPGDIQLISNHTVVHARTAYEDYPEPARRRHLLRLWLSLE
jgi:alpha-ketoglutarate-dependent taurine dioxygenase